jgi:hypothetical protein
MKSVRNTSANIGFGGKEEKGDAGVTVLSQKGRGSLRFPLPVESVMNKVMRGEEQWNRGTRSGCCGYEANRYAARENLKNTHRKR